MDGMEIKFKCEHCEQEYFQDTINLAVFLCGIFFLLGKESGYAGITCPRCLKTIIHEGEKNQIESFRETLSSLVSFGNTQCRLDLRYHSSVNNLPHYIKQYSDIEFYNWNTRLSDEDIDSLEYSIHRYIEEEKLDENLFCTYAFDDKPPMGSFLSIGWFKKDWVEELIKIETENSVRIFPRYVPYSSLYEDIEKFCWNNHIHLDSLEHFKNEVEVNRKQLKMFEEQNNLKILNRPDSAMLDDIDREKDQYIKYLKEIEFRTPFDFLSILISKHSPHDFLFLGPNDEIQATSFWKTLHPFLNHDLSKSLPDFDFAQLAKPHKGPKHNEMADLVKTNLYKESTHKSYFPRIGNTSFSEFNIR